MPVMFSYCLIEGHPRGGLFTRGDGTGAAGPRSGRSPGSPAPGGGGRALPELGGREGGEFSWNQPYRERKGPTAVICGRAFLSWNAEMEGDGATFCAAQKTISLQRI